MSTNQCQVLTWGVLPETLPENATPYTMALKGEDFQDVADIINQGIDSHLEAVFTKQEGSKITILNNASLRCFLRRCTESDNENMWDIAFCIMSTLDIEWI